jgi:hypothetical protein
VVGDVCGAETHAWGRSSHCYCRTCRSVASGEWRDQLNAHAPCGRTDCTPRVTLVARFGGEMEEPAPRFPRFESQPTHA